MRESDRADGVPRLPTGMALMGLWTTAWRSGHRLLLARRIDIPGSSFPGEYGAVFMMHDSSSWP